MKRFLFISLSVFFIMLLPVMVKADSTDEDSSKSYGDRWIFNSVLGISSISPIFFVSIANAWVLFFSIR